MAVTKIWAIHDSVSRVVDYCTNPSKTKLSDLEQVLLYAADKEKTLDEGEQQYAVTGIGCRAESAAREMAAVQRRFGKAGGNVAYHAYQSFKTGEVTAEECHRIGVETARRLWGNDRQVLVATHFNTGTYHNHFVVNPVNMWTGKKLEAKYEVYYKLRDMSDRVCKEHGLSVVKNPQRHKTARSVYFAEKDGEPTRYNLMRRALDEALTISSSWTELSAVLRKKGYVFVCDPYRRYATIRSLSAKKCMRTFRLGAEYDKEALQDRLLENQRDIRVTRRYFEFMRPYYRQEELERLLEASKDHPYSLLIQMTAFYGLRRSEALGLKWDAIDFERDTITIKHIVTNAKIDGKCEIVCADRAKTKSSLRSLPLVDNIREKLLAPREQQKENRRVCGNCYSKKYDGYVFVDAMGNIFNPRSVTANFSKPLEQNGLRHIRFHDLRHSCASLLLANDVPLKQIQEWLGHSDIGTTANIYSHLDYKSKITSANVMDNILTLPDTRQTGWHT